MQAQTAEVPEHAAQGSSQKCTTGVLPIDSAAVRPAADIADLRRDLFGQTVSVGILL